MDNSPEIIVPGVTRDALLAHCRTSFAQALSTAARDCGLGAPDLLEVLSRGAGCAFDELAGLHSREEFVKLRSLTASRISLVHPEDMDLTVALINLAHYLGDACEKHLPRLHLLFMTLLDQRSSVLDQLPVGPDAACAALRQLCDSGALPSGWRLDIPSRIEKSLARALDELYQALSRELTEAGVSPKSLLRSNQEGSSAWGHADTGVSSAKLSAGSPSVLNPLQQLQSSVLGRRASSGGDAVSSADPSLLQAILDQVTHWLTERQNEAARQPYGVDSAQVNLGELSRLLPARNNAALEAINLSFDALLMDREICFAVKPSLGRLRLPICKAVLIDETFLSDSQHPARRLLNAVLRLANILLPDEDLAHPVCQAIEESARQIQANFERDMTVFAEAADSLERLEQSHKTSSLSRAVQLMAVIEREARREQARSRSARAIKALCATEVPMPVRIFLERLWVRVLAHVHQINGEKSQEWIHALATANRLIESVQPKTDAEARKALVGDLPALLGELRAGLDLIAAPEVLLERALHSFAALHSAALYGKQPDKPVQQDALPPPVAPRIDTVPEFPGLQIIRLSPDSEPERELPNGLLHLKPGDWLQLGLPDASRRNFQVSWIGGMRRMLLLARPGEDVTLLLPLRWLVSQADARLLLVEEPFERAACAAMRPG